MKLTSAQASVLIGASTVLTIFPAPTVTRYVREIPSLYRPQASSLDALRSDWMKIGLDIHRITVRQVDVERTA